MLAIDHLLRDPIGVIYENFARTNDLSHNGYMTASQPFCSLPHQYSAWRRCATTLINIRGVIPLPASIAPRVNTGNKTRIRYTRQVRITDGGWRGV